MNRSRESRRTDLVVSCEHAGNRVPAAFEEVFRGAGHALASHRGWDPGAADIARSIASALDAPLFLHEETRLLIDLNRSLGHPGSFSEFTRDLPRPVRREIVETHYRPHRRRVEDAVEAAVAAGGRCLHISVHTFTPILGGEERTAEVGILFDPSRDFEREAATAWAEALRRRNPDWRVRRNYPYRGAADGFTTALRRLHPDPRYAGIELEINQALLSDADARRETAGRVAESLDWLTRDGPAGSGRA